MIVPVLPGASKAAGRVQLPTTIRAAAPCVMRMHDHRDMPCARPDDHGRCARRRKACCPHRRVGRKPSRETATWRKRPSLNALLGHTVNHTHRHKLCTAFRLLFSSTPSESPAVLPRIPAVGTAAFAPIVASCAYTEPRSYICSLCSGNWDKPPNIPTRSFCIGQESSWYACSCALIRHLRYDNAGRMRLDPMSLFLIQ